MMIDNTKEYIVCAALYFQKIYIKIKYYEEIFRITSK